MSKVLASLIVFVIFTSSTSTFAMICSKEMGKKTLGRSSVSQKSLVLAKSDEDVLLSFYQRTMRMGVVRVTDPQLSKILNALTGRAWNEMSQIEIQNLLFNAYKKTVYTLADRFSRQNVSDVEELRQEAMVAFLNALRGYSVKGETSFTGYLASYIEWALESTQEERKPRALIPAFIP